MNTSFWSHCQGLILRVKHSRARSRPRLRQQSAWIVEGLEARTLLSSTPAMVADINPGANSANITDLVAIGATSYFTANDGTHGQELWKSDGTAAGTMMVKDINPGSAGSLSTTAGNLTNVNGTLFFTANDGIHGAELWKSDGTAAGTTLVKDIFPGSTIYNGYYGYSNTPNSSSPTNLTNVNGTLFFSANDGSDGTELWKSDGTAAGTALVKDIFPGSTVYYGSFNTPNGSNPGNLTNVSGTLFFSANDGSSERELWKSDGTAVGTVRVSQAASNPHNLTNINGTLFFSASDSVDGEELWKSDGTTAGTTQVKDIFTGTTKYYQGPYGAYVLEPASSHPSNLTNVNGTLFFTAGDGAPGNLWKSDGTAAGTVKVTGATFLNSNQGSAAVNGTLYFGGLDGIHGDELWKSDGTAAGTALVKDIRTGSNGSYPSSFTNVNGTLYFSALDDVHGYELWKSDGTAAGTMMVKDIFPSGNINYGTNNYGNSNIGNLTNANGTLFFTAKDGVHGTELWALDTAPAPSLAVSGFPATITAGVLGSFTVVAKNADGTTNTGYSGTIHFTSSDPQAVLPADYRFTAADNGKHTFTANLKTAGTQSITAADTVSGSLVGTDGSITVTPAAASKFLISVPTIVKAGIAFSLTLTVEDAYGNLVTGYTGTVHFTSGDKTATLPANYTFTATDKGVHTFTGLILRKKGQQTITMIDTWNSLLTSSITENVS